MKLKNQLNLSFLVLVVSLLTLTALLFYMLSFQLLVKEQKKELEARGKAWVKVAVKEKQGLVQKEVHRLEKMPLKGGNVAVILYDVDQDQLLYSSYKPAKTQRILYTYNRSSQPNKKTMWNVSGQNYLIKKFSWVTKTHHHLILVLSSPIKGLRVLQTEFTKILLGLLLIGGVIVLVMNHFITKRLLKPLTQVNEQLEKVKKRKFDEIEEIQVKGEIGEVAHTTYQMANELHHYIESQKQFFQYASHELKTPLMSIQGFAEGVLDDVFEGDQAHHALSMIVAESDRIKNLVNEMLTLAKLEGFDEEDQTEVLLLGDLLVDAMNRVVSRSAEKEIEVELIKGVSGTIKANKDRLLQAFINLLQNAIRYADHHVWIRCVTEGPSIKVEIEDDGPGIPESLLPRLFHRFVKGEGGHNGLGLAISRAIIEKADGEVWAENRPEGGARFTIQFPLVKN